ncbi:hypothetical protein [Streptomyces puniciscabiei]|uniref:hypothetical protein n=1 Tax=Streptomyces puniciscabiei TaxID=164348 RepID=UPI0006EB292C|nr:hypothetical protein [Streptomyces puniciscabiei]
MTAVRVALPAHAHQKCDSRGTPLIPERRGGACWGLDGADGPNLVCAACGLPVAGRIDDCSLRSL